MLIEISSYYWSMKKENLDKDEEMFDFVFLILETVIIIYFLKHEDEV